MIISLISCLFITFYRFFVADKAVGAKGFKAIWTEIKDTSNCQEFRCTNSKICIPRNLRCNGINNCGSMDISDEENCVTESEVNEFMIIGLGMGILSMAFLTAILICHRKRKRKNHAEHPMLPSHAHFHTCESIGERFATTSSMDSVNQCKPISYKSECKAQDTVISTRLTRTPFTYTFSR